MSFTFLIPTHRDDRPLARCLGSIVHQLAPEDEVLVIGDVHSQSLERVPKLTSRYGPQFRYLPFDAGHHCYGHDQLNYGISQARGDYLHVNDDDDVWAPGALAIMRQAVLEEPARPHLFRFMSYHRAVFWDQYGLVERNHIGGHCLVAPNLPGKVGLWECYYTGDFDYVQSTLTLHGGNDSAVWHEDIVAVARPL